MPSLLEKERVAGKVQMIYLDPPYGINYNSNFQARIGNRSPKEAADATMTREPEQIQAYRDTWQLGVHSYLTYLRDRLLVARELLADSGSLFVQIGRDRMHLVRSLLDEVFGPDNAGPVITVTKTSGFDSSLLPEVSDFLLWYAKSRPNVKYLQLFEQKADKGEAYNNAEFQNGSRRRLKREEMADPTVLPQGTRLFTYGDITSQGTSRSVPFVFEGKTFHPGPNAQWKIRREG